jgi:hypothetical protein
MAMWSSERNELRDGWADHLGGAGDRQSRDDTGSRRTLTARKDTSASLPDSAVRHLFRISVELAGVVEVSSDPEVVRRIRQIMSDADDLIQEVRLVSPGAGTSWNYSDPAQEESDAAMPEVASLSSDQSLAMRLLQEASHAIDRSLTFTRRQSEKAAVNLEVDLEEASWAVHRAMIALTG